MNKLGLGIVAFDDTLHLRNITSEIRDLCDMIVVCLQKESYHGVPIDARIEGDIYKLKDEGLVDDVIWFVPSAEYDLSKPEAPRIMETDKRNFIIDFLSENGCDYAHIIDSDEFYDHDDYQNAKNVLIEHPDINVTYCEYINYYRDYRHLLVWPFKSYVPFISKVSYKFDFFNGSFDKPSDPTRRYLIEGKDAKYCIMSFSTVKMHHLSWIRTDIREKLKNWSAKKYFDDDELVEKVIERYENYEDGQNAFLLFNVPEYRVVVNKLSESYIHPKYPLV